MGYRKRRNIGDSEGLMYNLAEKVPTDLKDKIMCCCQLICKSTAIIKFAIFQLCCKKGIFMTVPFDGADLLGGSC